MVDSADMRIVWEVGAQAFYFLILISAQIVNARGSRNQLPTLTVYLCLSSLGLISKCTRARQFVLYRLLQSLVFSRSPLLTLICLPVDICSQCRFEANESPNLFAYDAGFVPNAEAGERHNDRGSQSDSWRHDKRSSYRQCIGLRYLWR